jgi:hypothetical protein
MMKRKLLMFSSVFSLFAFMLSCSSVSVKTDKKIHKEKQLVASVYVFPNPEPKIRLGLLMSAIHGKKAEENYTFAPMKDFFIASLGKQSAAVESMVKFNFNSSVPNDLNSKLIQEKGILDLSGVSSQIKTDYLLTCQIEEYGNVEQRVETKVKYVIYDVKNNEPVWVATAENEAVLPGMFPGTADNSNKEKVHKALEKAVDLSVKDIFETLSK